MLLHQSIRPQLSVRDLKAIPIEIKNNDTTQHKKGRQGSAVQGKNKYDGISTMERVPGRYSNCPMLCSARLAYYCTSVTRARRLPQPPMYNFLDVTMQSVQLPTGTQTGSVTPAQTANYDNNQHGLLRGIPTQTSSTIRAARQYKILYGNPGIRTIFPRNPQQYHIMLHCRACNLPQIYLQYSIPQHNGYASPSITTDGKKQKPCVTLPIERCHVVGVNPGAKHAALLLALI